MCFFMLLFCFLNFVKCVTVSVCKHVATLSHWALINEWDWTKVEQFRLYNIITLHDMWERPRRQGISTPCKSMTSDRLTQQSQLFCCCTDLRRFGLSQLGHHKKWQRYWFHRGVVIDMDDIKMYGKLSEILTHWFASLVCKTANK